MNIRTLLVGFGGDMKDRLTDLLRPVSYTHLDVYKRQVWRSGTGYLRGIRISHIALSGCSCSEQIPAARRFHEG